MKNCVECGVLTSEAHLEDDMCQACRGVANCEDCGQECYEEDIEKGLCPYCLEILNEENDESRESD